MNRYCRYGRECVSKNPAHYLLFQHPEDETTTTPGLGDADESNENVIASDISGNENAEHAAPKRSPEDFLHVLSERGRMAEKLSHAGPYNIFLTAVTASKPTHTELLSVTFQDLLDESLGEIESSLHLTNALDILWLLGHYMLAGLENKPLTILYGVKDRLNDVIASKYSNVSTHYIRVVPFATANAKLILHAYTDGSMRIMVPSANLYEEDWDNRTQTVWISPRLAPLDGGVEDGATGESPTKFRADLIRFLKAYKLPVLRPWIKRIRRSDFSEVNVFLVASVPGFSRDSPTGYPYGHPRLAYLLRRHCSTPIPSHVPIVAQSSVLGYLDGDIRDWMQSNFLNSLRKDSRPLASLEFPPLQLIYPSSANVAGSHDGLIGASFVMYTRDRDIRQPWVRQHLCQWSSDRRHRTKALSHTKTYARFNEAARCAYWVLLTSANIAKNGWGTIELGVSEDEALLLNVNYELGVLFMPKFVTNEDTFPLKYERNGMAPFPLPYDVPLLPYQPNDTPYFSEDLEAFLKLSAEKADSGEKSNEEIVTNNSSYKIVMREIMANQLNEFVGFVISQILCFLFK